MKQQLSITLVVLTIVAVSAKSLPPLVPTCQDRWNNAKCVMDSILSKTEEAWTSLCTMMQEQCAIKKSVSSGIIQYTYHFFYKTEEITISTKENIEIQKKCSDLISKSQG